MSTITTNFPNVSLRRSHATRFADGVIAGYIHALAGPASRAASADPRSIVAGPALALAGDVAGPAVALAGNAGGPEEAGNAATELVSAAIEANQSHAPRGQSRARKGGCWSRGGRIGHVMRAQRQLEAR